MRLGWTGCGGGGGGGGGVGDKGWQQLWIISGFDEHARHAALDVVLIVAAPIESQAVD